MRTITITLSLVALSAVTSSCSRNAIEAVNLSNEADKQRESNPDEAISQYEQAKNLDPSNVRILWKLARVYQKKENWEKIDEKKNTGWADAKDPLEQAAKLDPNYADPHFDLANVLYHMDDEHGALEEYTKAIQLKPDLLAAYGELADLYRRLGFHDQAMQVVKEGVTWDKGDKSGFNLHTLYGFLLEQQGDISSAIAEYEKAKNAC